MPGGWAGSNRSATLPPNWRTIRRRILQRDSHACQWTDDGQTCGLPANEVDHTGDRTLHTDSNLRALCTWHHARRSSAQGNATRTPLRERRNAEQHPGLHPNNGPINGPTMGP